MIKKSSIVVLFVAFALSFWNLWLVNGQTTMMPCQVGQYKPGAICLSCPAGYYCPGNTKIALPCPVGTSTNNATGAGQCTNCTMGTYTSTTGSKACLACPAGSFCPNTTTAIQCNIGTAGKIHASDFRYDTTQCVGCPIGTYANKLGSSVCSICPNGSYCPDPTSGPVPCPKGRSSLIAPEFINGTGVQYFYWQNYYFSIYYYSWSYPPTIYMNSRSYNLGEICFPCPVGFYANQLGQTFCTNCPSGYYCPDKTAPPIKCPIGYYSNNNVMISNMWPSYNLGDTCQKCPQGTYTKSPGSTYCLPCPSGMYCPDPGLNPIMIPSGAFVYNNTIWTNNGQAVVSAVQYCSPGQYLLSVNSFGNDTTTTPSYMQQQNQCEYCPAGYFCSDPTKPPQPCPRGFYSYSSYSYTTSCQACSQGTYASELGSTQCSNCPAGSFCPVTTDDPIPCPAGMYSYGNQVACWSCWSGTYSKANSTECTYCTPGCCCNDPSQDPVCPSSSSTSTSFTTWMSSTTDQEQSSMPWPPSTPSKK